jgi:hypothetical protein
VGLVARFLQRFFAYGFAGLLIETFFTGFHQALLGDWHLQTTSYLWMLPVYALGGILYDLLDRTGWNRFAVALVYVPIIYAQELLWGLLFRATMGCPWSYEPGFWAPLGLINLRYVGFWFLLALVFVPARQFLRKIQQLRAF